MVGVVVACCALQASLVHAAPVPVVPDDELVERQVGDRLGVPVE